MMKEDESHRFRTRFVPPLFTHAEAMRFRIHGIKTRRNDGNWEEKFDPLPFPRTYGERKAYIFSHTGHAANPMDWREWYCFNYAMNKSLDIGLPIDGADSTLMMLSLIDHALSQPPRFVGMAHMPPLRADSTSAHSKQSMNLGQSMFENRRLYFDGNLKPEYNTFRREAMLGFWVHDMGECIFEIVTASDRFGLTQNESTWLTNRKNEVESKAFTFVCQLATHCIAQGKPEEFILTINALRERLLAAQPTPRIDEKPQLALLRARMEAMETGMAEVKARPDFTDEIAAETRHLVDIYERTERAGSFLHNFVKTLEGVEGQRYLQRNSVETPTDYWSHRLHNESQHPPRPSYDLSGDHDIMMGIHRAERRLPDLFATAHTSGERELAKATAAFTYASIARQFTPLKGEQVALAPAIIDREPVVPENNTALSLSELTQMRTKQMATKHEALSTQNPDDYNVRYYARARAGALYRAAEYLVCDGFTRTKGFIPETDCLLRRSDTPEMPVHLAQAASMVEQKKLNTVTPIKGSISR